MTDLRCEDCKFFQLVWRASNPMNPNGPEDAGLCKRYAPRSRMISSDDTPRGSVEWPVVTWDEWCGEFARREPT